MRGARRLGWLQTGLGGACLVLIAVGAATVASAVSLSHAPAAAVADACSALLPSPLAMAALASLLLPILAASVVILGARSLMRQLRATRRHRRSLSLTGSTVRIGGVDCIVVGESRSLAFCAGLLRPHIYLSEGALASLSAAELEAVVAHERHHQRGRDPLRMLGLRTLADALAFVPALRAMSARHAALRELSADAAAIRATGSRAPLASALLRFGAPTLPGSPAAVAGIAAERVDHLRGDPAAGRWALPAGAVARSGLPGVGLVVVTAGLAFAGPPSGSLVLLAAQSCMPAMFATAVAAGLVVLSRRMPTLTRG